MIKSLTITNFKGFNNLQIPSLSRITLLGGYNNVGKTSILEALFLFHDRLNPAMFLQQSNFRGIVTLNLASDALWTSLFNEFNMNSPININIKRESPEHLSLKIVSDYERTITHTPAQQEVVKTESKTLSTLALEIKYKKGNEEQLSYMTLDQGVVNLDVKKATSKKLPKATFLPARMQTNPNEDAMRFGNLDIINKTDLIVDFLKEVEPRIKNLSPILVNGVSYIHADIGFSRKIPIKLMGDGISRLLSIILAIADSPGGIVLIDEVENGIHYSAMPAIWKGIVKAAQDFDCQVIATTHSYECLQSAHEGVNNVNASNEFTYIRLDRNNDNIIPKIFTNKLLDVALSSNMEVR
ncbi:MAG TPA: AAA family ATPase [Methylomusa anaerophila]|uniref:ATP/GTP phosphatase n=1 Tax=Methylomusa anaerophila TaxID=1930071 RepID=A0A348AJ29_9FIRM|nr:ATP-binding protein [Methylomusa anaerophila]BBB91077.1 ATP/GTP phosphatase [Methylomusa anaerophila]HML88952.1 AAA family ATPase [Methylomusa anaerophila]